MNFLKRVRTYICATLRLIILHFISFLNGIHNIFFNDIEIVNLQLIVRPNNCVTDKVSYIQKLRSNNMDLIADEGPIDELDEGIPTDAFNEDDFKPDSEYDLEDDDYEGEDEDDSGEDKSL